jgi:hypothetical protein
VADDSLIPFHLHAEEVGSYVLAERDRDAASFLMGSRRQRVLQRASRLPHAGSWDGGSDPPAPPTGTWESPLRASRGTR